MKTLETMKKVLSDFISFDGPTMIGVYAEEYGWGNEDYEADKDNAGYLLEQVERRMKSLGHHLAKVKTERSSKEADPETPVASLT
jgi:hypothetical protein